MKLVTTEDAQLRCEHSLRPGAPALLLLNPLGSSLEIWDDPFRRCASATKSCATTCAATASRRPDRKPRSRWNSSRATRLPCWTACGIARAHLCGLSIGGMTAMQIATLVAGSRAQGCPVQHFALHADARILEHSESKRCARQGVAPLIDGILQRWLTTPYRMANPDKVECIRAMLLAVKPQGYAACVPLFATWISVNRSRRSRPRRWSSGARRILQRRPLIMH